MPVLYHIVLVMRELRQKVSICQLIYVPTLSYGLSWIWLMTKRMALHMWQTEMHFLHLVAGLQFGHLERAQTTGVASKRAC